MIDELRTKIANYTDIFVFGRGSMGQAFFQMLSTLYPGKLIRYCDSNAPPGAPPDATLLRPDEAAARYADALFCIGSVVHSKAMVGQLAALGIPEANILLTPQCVMQEDKRRKLIPRTALGGFEYHLTEHCNLKCAGCLHFSNIAEEEFADIDVFIRDINRLKEILGSGLTAIRLCGGEPLLHPAIEDFIEGARKLLPKAQVTLVTNGVLLMSMPDSFWSLMKRCGVSISMTEYPVGIDIAGIRRKAVEFGVQFATTVFSKNWNKHIFDLSGRLDPVESFVNCPRANGICVRLCKGRLYPCTIVGNAEHFNRKFNQNLLHKDEDSLDIYADITKEDIYDFLAKPVSFCRYCDVTKLRAHEWMLSRHQIDEYLP